MANTTQLDAAIVRYGVTLATATHEATERTVVNDDHGAATFPTQQGIPRLHEREIASWTVTLAYQTRLMVVPGFTCAGEPTAELVLRSLLLQTVYGRIEPAPEVLRAVLLRAVGVTGFFEDLLQKDTTLTDAQLESGEVAVLGSVLLALYREQYGEPFALLHLLGWYGEQYAHLQEQMRALQAFLDADYLLFLAAVQADEDPDDSGGNVTQAIVP
jgi:hypothetical protein